MGIRTTKARAKKVFARKGSKAFKKDLNRKVKNQHKINVNEAVILDKSIKTVKQKDKVSKYKNRINNHLN